MTSSTASTPSSRWLAMACAAAGVVLFHYFGNAVLGYIRSASLFYWWGFQWVNPRSETEHGWLILGLSVWVWWRNLSVADCGLRIADHSTPETGDSKPGTGIRRPELQDWTPGTGNRNPEAVESELDDDRERDLHAVEVAKKEVIAVGLGNRQSAIRDPQSARDVWAPLAAMIGGLALHALGFAAQQTRVSILAFLIFTWGVVRLGGGRRWGDAAMFPLAFMVFALPISVLDEIGLPLRVWVTTAGEHIAHLAGIDVLRSGTQLVAPDGRFNYDVAAPCSGVRSLMALTALSVLVGYLNFQSWRRRALVLGLSFPLVYLGNVARIVAIIFAAQAGGPEWGDRAHEVMGYGVFVIVLGGVLLSVALIHRWWPEGGQAAEVRGRNSEVRVNRRRETGDAQREKKEEMAGVGGQTSELEGHIGRGAMQREPEVRERRGAPNNMIAVSVAALVVTVVVAEMFLLQRLGAMPTRGQVGVVLALDGLNPVELPSFLGTEWIGRRAEVSAVEREMLPPDTGFSRKNYVFVGDRTREVFLSIVLSGRDRTSIHRPELCLVGQGWTIDGATQQTFLRPKEDAKTSEGFRATVLRVRREIPSPRGTTIVPQLVAYWFVAGDVIVPTHWQRFVHDAWNRVTQARADRWAYVLVQTDARDGEAAALARMQTVLEGTLPVFQRALPAE